jgi:hypothetical protein
VRTHLFLQYFNLPEVKMMASAHVRSTDQRQARRKSYPRALLVIGTAIT